MDIKWKSRIRVIGIIFLFTFGLSGILTAFDNGDRYIKSDYFETSNFESQLSQFIIFLNLYELNAITKEEAKANIVVTEEEIQEHRYRYGDLPQQIENIKAQYEGRIQEAISINNQELANSYMTERDAKLEDITNNFKSDEHVRPKVVKEKEEKIEEYFREKEKLRREFQNYQTVFKYYFKDRATGEIYTNLPLSKNNPNEKFNRKDMVFLRTYPSVTGDYLNTLNSHYVLSYNEEVYELTEGAEKSFEGQIGVLRAPPEGNSLLTAYYDFEQKQRVFFAYVLGGLLALFGSFYLNKQSPIGDRLPMEQWSQLYRRIPLDIRGIMIGFSGLFSLIALSSSCSLYYHRNLFSFVTKTFSNLAMTSLLIFLVILQGKFIVEEVKDLSILKESWKKALIHRIYKSFGDAFLIRSIGTKIFVLLTIVFGLGGGAAVVLIEPRMILIYAPLSLIIGLPIMILILRRAGYFNRIVRHAEELAHGNLEPDLPVMGKSVLANLAQNINALKYGVKTSKREQAKSERLKTELITNVSHDLRTPLTSIINYTELLKKSDLPAEDRDAYIQIIDRKSKRLKVLIDDLFEASKMASGNIELSKEKVDLVQLLQQALAEHDERIGESSLQFRVIKPDTPVYAVVDGQKIWRVFDNLIGNILKYALENTRVYISIKEFQGEAVITFKNVTKYELGENTDELFERFKRGDVSRHTEGSGLGLAIAKSIIDLHGGSLDIEVDGDLFKVTVSVDI